VTIFLIERRVLGSWPEIREYMKSNSESLHLKLMTCKKNTTQPDQRAEVDVSKAKMLLTGLSLHVIRRTNEVAGSLLAWARDRLGAVVHVGEINCINAVKHAIFSTNGVQTLDTDVRVRPDCSGVKRKLRKITSVADVQAATQKGFVIPSWKLRVAGTAAGATNSAPLVERSIAEDE
jgi:hypothetical protein